MAPKGNGEASGSVFRDARAAARHAGLFYCCDAEPGISRHPRGKGFSYLSPAGSPLRDRHTLDRIHRLAIPPAWTDVWIAPDADAHLAATGRDARGRKQYRYNAEFARVLGNTVAVCRKCYVHPAVLARYEAGDFRLAIRERRCRERFALGPEEAAVLRFLEQS